MTTGFYFTALNTLIGGVLGSNNFIKPLIEISEKNDISCWVIEEPSFQSNYSRRRVVQFDFILLLIIFLRKIIKGDFIEKDNKIGYILRPIFFRNKIEHIIVQSQSMVSFLEEFIQMQKFMITNMV